MAVFGVALPAEADGGTVSGNVSGPGGGPLDGVTVHAWSDIDDQPGQLEDRGSTTTDSSGNYSLSVDASPITLCFAKSGYVPECHNDRYQPFGLDPVFITGDPLTVPSGGTTVNAAMIVGSSIAGTVSTEFGPLSDSVVTARSTSPFWLSSTTPGPDGSFTLSHLPPGTYTICVSSTTVIQRCTGDVGGPASYAVDADDVVSNANVPISVSRPYHLHVLRTAATAVRWQWDAVPGATSYRVAISRSSIMQHATTRIVTGTDAAFTGLTPGKPYYVAVRAIGTGFITPTVYTARSAIIGGRAHYVMWTGELSVTTHSQTWYWAEYSGAPKYEIRMSSTPQFTGYRSIKTSSLSATFSSLVPNSNYFVKVRALTSAGNALTGWGSTVSTSTAQIP